MLLRQDGHPFIKVIQTYYQGCNEQNFALLMSSFTPGIVHHFLDHSAVVGAEALANYWCKVAPTTQANWHLDHALVQESEAVIEWSMRCVPPQTCAVEILRGSEWYVFEGERISEIRSYHCNYYLNALENRELHDFDYAGRGYRQT